MNILERINQWAYSDSTDWRAEYFKLRGAYDRLASLHASDAHPGANCDGEWQTKFCDLEKDYKALRTSTNEMWHDAMAYRSLKSVAKLFQS